MGFNWKMLNRHVAGGVAPISAAKIFRKLLLGAGKLIALN